MQYWFFKALSRFLCLLPYGLVLSTGRILGKLYYYIAAKQRNRATRQMMRSLNISKVEADSLARKMFDNIGKNFVEILRTPKLTKENYQDFITINHLERFEDAFCLLYTSFNMRLAPKARELGIPVVSYIPPSAWAWRKGRAKSVAKIVDKIASIFPFEAEVYQKAGADVEFVGHPLICLLYTSRCV